jgi:hypothetical protein
MNRKNRDNIIPLNKQDEFDLEAKVGAEIYRVCLENDVYLSPRYEELLKLMQVPEVARSMFARLLEVKTIFSVEIKKFFRED